MRRWMVIIIAVLYAGMLSAQTDKWAQFSFSGGYGHFSDTFEKSGAFYTADMEVHFTRRVYGSFLVGMSSYEGSRPVWVEYPHESISDNLSDKRTEMTFAVGPGFDWLTNHIDRFYLTLYAGYAVVKRESSYYEGYVRQFVDDNRNGVMGLARLGYEHQFGESFVLGTFAQGGYVGESFSWGAGVRIGFRLSDFNVKKPAGLFK